MNTNASLAIFKEMKLEGMHQAYHEVLEMPIQNRPETDELLAHLLDREQQYRANKKAAMCLKNEWFEISIFLGRNHFKSGKKFDKKSIINFIVN